MRLVIDTNVFISGVFFSGPPYEILDSWRTGKITLILSPDILAEYQETSEELSAQFPIVELTPWFELLAAKACLVHSPPLLKQVCSDQDDDKFLACALASRSKVIVSGDKALLAVSGYQGIKILTPRKFVDLYLR